MSVEVSALEGACLSVREHPVRLAAGEIHVWLAYYGKIDDQELLSEYRLMLKDEERQQERRFYFARDRHQYLVTRALVRSVLSRYAIVRPDSWVFTTNAYGRPEIESPNGDSGNLSFNISHTHGLIVLGVTRRGALGLDVENTQSREAPVGIADRFFASCEAIALGALSGAAQRERFWEYWTFKEAYIKARAMGLAIPLDKFSFSYPSDERVEFWVHPDLGDRADRWQFWQLRPTSEHLLAICAQRSTEQLRTIVVRNTVPLVSEDFILPLFSRTS